MVSARQAVFAARLAQLAPTDVERTQLAFQLCFAREPDEDELLRSLDFLQHATTSADDDSADRDTVLTTFCQAMFSLSEFHNID